MFSNSGGGFFPDMAGGNQEAPPLSVAKVLHFIQSEFSRFEQERAKWQQETSELKAQIADLEGQRLADTNLKRDLLRRIKMLEYVIRTERAQRSESANTTTTKPFEASSDPEKSDEDTLRSLRQRNAGGRKIKEGRQILFQYLKEMGYTDEIIHAQAQRLKASFDEWPPKVTIGTATAKPKLKPRFRADSSSESENDDDGNHPEDGVEEPDDDPTAPFGFLDDEKTGDDNGSSGSEEFEVSGPVASVVQEVKSTSGGGGGGNIAIAAVDPNVEQKQPEELPPVPPRKKRPPPLLPPDPNDNDHDDLDPSVLEQINDAGKKLLGRQSRKGKSKRRGHADSLFAVGDNAGADSTESKGLSELFDLNTTATSPSKEEKRKQEVAKLSQKENVKRKTWSASVELHGHYEGVQSVAFHNHRQCLASGSRDMTVKLWNYPDPRQSHRKTINKPRTFRGHTSPVLTVAIDSSADLIFSGDSKGNIGVWKIPDDSVSLYEEYSNTSSSGIMNNAHTDAVWALDVHPEQSLVMSAGADGVCCLWDTSNDTLAERSRTALNFGPISCGQFSPAAESRHFVLGFTDGSVRVLDIETSTVVTKLETEGDSNINCVIAHHTLPIIATCDEAHHISYYDKDTGKLLHSHVAAHQDAVSSISFDPSGLYMVSVGHDRSVRVWDNGSKNCVSEVTTHRPNRDEAINDVVFHSKLPYFASAGADSIIKIFA